jgi:hypothetical protein
MSPFVGTLVDSSRTRGFEGLNVNLPVPPDDTLPGRIRALAEKWLIEDGWQLEPDTGEGVLWAYVASNDRRTISVGQRTGHEDALLLLGVVNLGSDVLLKFNRLPAATQDALLWDIRFELIRLNDTEFDGIDASLKNMKVMRRIFFDGLTKDSFYQAVIQIDKGISIILWMIGRRLT